MKFWPKDKLYSFGPTFLQKVVSFGPTFLQKVVSFGPTFSKGC